jgi:hypothetical protein
MEEASTAASASWASCGSLRKAGSDAADADAASSRSKSCVDAQQRRKARILGGSKFSAFFCEQRRFRETEKKSTASQGNRLSWSSIELFSLSLVRRQQPCLLALSPRRRPRRQAPPLRARRRRSQGAPHAFPLIPFAAAASSSAPKRASLSSRAPRRSSTRSRRFSTILLSPRVRPSL